MPNIVYYSSALIRKIILHKIMTIFGSLRERERKPCGYETFTDKEKDNIQLSQIMCTNKNSIEKRKLFFKNFK